MGPPLRSINRHNRHSKSILSVTKRRRFIQWLRGGPAAPRGLAAPPNCHTGQKQCKEPTLNRLRSKDQERPRKEAVDHKAAAPLDPSAPVIFGSHAQPTSLTYKRSLTPAGLNTPRKSISFPLFCSLRVGFV
jgi:hypothetical protein